MAQRRHHYEAAFEEYLRANRMPYVAVDEARKALLPGGAPARASPQSKENVETESSPDAPRNGALKSFDFVVYARRGNLLVDIKGRKIARRARVSARTSRGRLESWVTREDISSLSQWKRLFGDGFDAAFVFVYWCEEQPPDGLFQDVFEHRGRWYAVRSVGLEPYIREMKPRSERWGTVHVPSGCFERISEPFDTAA